MQGMDFVIGFNTFGAERKDKLCGKTKVFNPLTGWFFRALGGTPVNRNSNENKVSAIAKILRRRMHFEWQSLLRNSKK